MEVRSGKIGTLKSLRLFLDEHPDTPFGIRFSMNELSWYDRILSGVTSKPGPMGQDLYCSPFRVQRSEVQDHFFSIIILLTFFLLYAKLSV